MRLGTKFFVEIFLRLVKSLIKMKFFSFFCSFLLILQPNIPFVTSNDKKEW